MYDTLNIYKARNWGENKTFPQNLTDVKEHISERGNYVSGNLENLTIISGDLGTSIKGSVNKYLHNNNFDRMTRSDTKQAIEKIEDNLQIIIKTGKLGRIDIANHFLMERQPKEYYRYMEQTQYYTRLLQPYSLYFQNGKRQLLFYDKVKEGKAKGETIPEIWQGKNVMRYEARFIGRIKQQFKKEIIVSDLYDEQFYISIIDRWVNEFQRINKMKALKPIGSNLTPQQYQDYMLAKYINQNGYDSVLQELEADKHLLTNDKAVQRMKAKIKNSEFLTEESEMMKELETKILGVQKYYR